MLMKKRLGDVQRRRRKMWSNFWMMRKKSRHQE
jgi:hypothetical protein